MSVLDTKFVQGFIRMCNDGWEQGWHERNGGNLSYRVKPEEGEEVKENFEAIMTMNGNRLAPKSPDLRANISS